MVDLVFEAGNYIEPRVSNALLSNPTAPREAGVHRYDNEASHTFPGDSFAHHVASLPARNPPTARESHVEAHTETYNYLTHPDTVHEHPPNQYPAFLLNQHEPKTDKEAASPNNMLSLLDPDLFDDDASTWNTHSLVPDDLTHHSMISVDTEEEGGLHLTHDRLLDNTSGKMAKNFHIGGLSSDVHQPTVTTDGRIYDHRSKQTTEFLYSQSGWPLYSPDIPTSDVERLGKFASKDNSRGVQVASHRPASVYLKHSSFEGVASSDGNYPEHHTSTTPIPQPYIDGQTYERTRDKPILAFKETEKNSNPESELAHSGKLLTGRAKKRKKNWQLSKDAGSQAKQEARKQARKDHYPDKHEAPQNPSLYNNNIERVEATKRQIAPGTVGAAMPNWLQRVHSISNMLKVENSMESRFIPYMDRLQTFFKKTLSTQFRRRDHLRVPILGRIELLTYEFLEMQVEVSRL